MTLCIERLSVEGRTVVRLIGRVQAECLAEVQAQLRRPGPRPALDMEEVTLVDVEVVRFLKACERDGIELLRCSPYIRLWMANEGPCSDAGRSRRGETA